MNRIAHHNIRIGRVSARGRIFAKTASNHDASAPKSEHDVLRLGRRLIKRDLGPHRFGGMALLLPLRHAGGGGQRKLGALGW